VLLTRHGQTIYNEAGIMQGTLDSPLTKLGIAQAEAVGEELLRNHHDPSELGIINPVRIKLDATVVEVTWGEWNGLTRHQIAKRDPTLWQARENDKWLTRPPKGESYKDIADRLAAWLVDHQDLENLLVVAHGAVNRVIRGLYLDLPFSEILTLEETQGVYFKLTNGKISRYPKQ
jgi:probable phosphoglycerate mutase